MSRRIESSEPQEVKARFDGENLHLPTDIIAATVQMPHDQRSAVETLAPEEKRSAATLSQWQLIWLRFSKHWLALGSFYVLIVLYGVATLAEFFAPYGSATKNVNMIYCPPQIPVVSLVHGLYAVKLRREINPITLKNYYVETEETLPLGFFVTGEHYRLWGLFGTRLHFSDCGIRWGEKRGRRIFCWERTSTDGTC